MKQAIRELGQNSDAMSRRLHLTEAYRFRGNIYPPDGVGLLIFTANRGAITKSPTNL